VTVRPAGAASEEMEARRLRPTPGHSNPCQRLPNLASLKPGVWMPLPRSGGLSRPSHVLFLAWRRAQEKGGLT